MSSGHNTYLHCAPKPGWPNDHKAEDTFDLPAHTIMNVPRQTGHEFRMQATAPPPPEYYSEGLHLIRRVTSIDTVAIFKNAKDAQEAAQALNNHKGY